LRSSSVEIVCPVVKVVLPLSISLILDENIRTEGDGTKVPHRLGCVFVCSRVPGPKQELTSSGLEVASKVICLKNLYAKCLLGSIVVCVLPVMRCLFSPDVFCSSATRSSLITFLLLLPVFLRSTPDDTPSTPDDDEPISPKDDDDDSL